MTRRRGLSTFLHRQPFPPNIALVDTITVCTKCGAELSIMFCPACGDLSPCCDAPIEWRDRPDRRN